MARQGSVDKRCQESCEPVRGTGQEARVCRAQPRFDRLFNILIEGNPL